MVKIECIQNAPKDLGSVLYEDIDFTDVTLVCGDGQQVKCHRSILAASSGFLRRLLVESDQQQTFLFLGAKVEVEVVRALMQLIYLGGCIVLREKFPALAALQRELQIVERFNEEDVNAPIQEEVSIGRQGLVSPTENCLPELVEPLEFQFQVDSLPDIDSKVQEEVASPRKTKEKEKQTKCHKILKEENWEPYKEDDFTEMFSSDEVKSEEVGVGKRPPQSKKLPKISIPPPDQFEEYTCEQCDYKSSDKYKLKYHVLIKHEGLSYDCDECQSKFSRSDTLAIHVRRNHGDEFNVSFICDLCGKNLETEKGMKSHSVEQACTKCKFISCGTLVQMHMKTAHNPYFCDGYYNCDKCAFRTEKYAKMNFHARESHVKTFINCNQCTFKTNRKRNLKAHVNDQHNSSQPAMAQDCELCQKRFRNKRLYVMHKKRHHGEKRINCDSCDFKASSPYLLIEHKRTKHDFIKYNCDECEAKFNFKGCLKKHVDRKHRGKVFLCKQCQFVAKTYGSLKRHSKKIHLGKVHERDDARYTCDKCSTQFSRESALEKHLKNLCQDQIFQCKKCDMRFSSLGNLRRHGRNICKGKAAIDQTQNCKSRDCCTKVPKPRSEEN